jgi:uncharacterized RDD family membrane protein YckC
VDGTRSALIVASDDYSDPGLRRLRAPAADAQALAAVLQDPKIGGFQVRTLLNQPAHEVNLAVEEFFADRRPDDLLLMHVSCHGVKDEGGELYFATANTRLRRLGSTAVAADFVNRRMNRSRSRRVVLLLDCCYAGAFERGMTARAGTEMGIEEQFGGLGRAVITASSAMEYAFEGDQVADISQQAPSVFTSALVEGLETGEADRDQDGLVALDELYDYVFDKVRAVTPNQTPGKWMFGVQGELVIARRGRPVTTAAPLPPELQQLVDHPVASARAGAVQELQHLLSARHAGLALAARQTLERLTNDDSRMVSAAASAALGEQAEPLPPTPPPPRLELSATVLDFGRLPQHSQSPERPVRLTNAGGGNLNAQAATQASWLKVRQVGDELLIAVDTEAVGQHEDIVTVDSDGGSATIRVAANVNPQAITTPQPDAAAVVQPPPADQTNGGRVRQPPSRPPPQPARTPTAASPHQMRQQPQPDHRANDYYQGVKLATWMQRMGAGLIDFLVLLPGIILLFAGSFADCPDDPNAACTPEPVVIWIGVALIVAVKIYNRWYLQGTTGRSWGKRSFDLRLVRMADKQPIGFGAAFMRGLAHLFDILSFGVGFLLPITDERRQTLADKAAGTIVIYQDKTGSGRSSTS